jgi:hypothetical protein
MCDWHFQSALEVLDLQASCQFAAKCDSYPASQVADEPALVVLLQSHPGEFSQPTVDELRRRWPLARIVAIAGSWCEGEPRTGGMLAGVYRMTWEIAAARLNVELPELAAGRGAFALPPTATAEEFTTTAPPRSFEQRLVVAVAARRISTAEPMIDALHAAGACTIFYSLADPPVVRGVDAVLWDVAGCEQAVDAFRAKLPRDARLIVAVCDFPRPQDLQRFDRLGVSSVLGRPLQLDDLLGSIENALPRVRLAASPRAENGMAG